MRGARILASLALTLNGCSAPPRAKEPAGKPSSPAVHAAMRDSGDPVDALVRRAEQALLDDAPLDYERPLVEKPRDRQQALKLVLEACHAGDSASCWKAMVVAAPNERAPIVKLVEQNCRGGHVLSCRALPDDAGQGLQGTFGRSYDCQSFDPDRCNPDELRRECNEGFPESCTLLASRTHDDTERPALFARAAELARQGCREDILKECAMRRADWPAEAALDAAQRSCKLSRDDCAQLWRLLDKGDRAEEARNALEIACQYGTSDLDCMELGLSYLDRKYPEPVPGRGQALLDRSCAELLRVATLVKRAAEVTTLYPGCKRAAKK